MSRLQKRERRRYPRVVEQLPIEVAADGYDFISTTQNISCVGAYCHIDKYIPPFTRIMIKLSLPLPVKNQGNKKMIECKGVVVRTEDEEEGGFNIAIFFNEIKEEQRKKISEYIKSVLSSQILQS